MMVGPQMCWWGHICAGRVMGLMVGLHIIYMGPRTNYSNLDQILLMCGNERPLGFKGNMSLQNVNVMSVNNKYNSKEVLRGLSTDY